MPRLTESERNQAIGMLQKSGVSEVAAFFNTSLRTIKLLRARLQQTGSVKDRPRSGRPRVTTVAEDRRIRTLHLRNRFKTASHTARTFPVNISRHTVRRRLMSFGITCCRPARRLKLMPHHMQERLNWTQAHRRWTLRQWEQVIFSDESRFLLERHEGRRRVYRRKGERFLNCTVSTASDRRSVMVWGAISATGKTDLVIIRGNVTANRYIDQCLRPQLLPFIQRQNNGTIFQHDNARPHTAIITRQFLAQNNVNVLRWPAMSPDLNPIEHLWDRLDREVRQQVPPPRTLQQLEQSLVNAWNGLHLMDIRRLCLSMRRRCTSVIDARGSHTRY